MDRQIDSQPGKQAKTGRERHTHTDNNRTYLQREEERDEEREREKTQRHTQRQRIRGRDKETGRQRLGQGKIKKDTKRKNNIPEALILTPDMYGLPRTCLP